MDNNGYKTLSRSAYYARRLLNYLVSGEEDIDEVILTIDYKECFRIRSKTFGEGIFLNPKDIQELLEDENQDSVGTLVETINFATFAYHVYMEEEYETCINSFFQYVNKQYSTEEIDLYFGLKMELLTRKLKVSSDKEYWVKEIFPHNANRLHLPPNASHNDEIISRNRHLAASLLESEDASFAVKNECREYLIKYLDYRLNHYYDHIEPDNDEVDENVVLYDEGTVTHFVDPNLEAPEDESYQLDSSEKSENESVDAQQDLDHVANSPKDLNHDASSSNELDHNASFSGIANHVAGSPEATTAPASSRASEAPLSPSPATSTLNANISFSPSFLDEDNETNYYANKNGKRVRIPKVRSAKQPWSKEDVDALENFLSRYKENRSWSMFVNERDSQLSRFSGTQVKDKAENELVRRTRSGLPIGGFIYAKSKKTDRLLGITE